MSVIVSSMFSTKSSVYERIVRTNPSKSEPPFEVPASTPDLSSIHTTSAPWRSFAPGQGSGSPSNQRRHCSESSPSARIALRGLVPILEP
ncbi:hypothetical protein GS918_27635, partial [Rhodococcus hoagii]|nr:hypothetical protein [Prescottella equi]